MTPLDEAAQAATVTARAAAGLCDAADMQRTMQQAREDIARTVASMMDAGHFDTCAACGHIRACHDPVCRVDDCDGTCAFVEPQPKCPICGYYLTIDDRYAGYRCVDPSHWAAAGFDMPDEWSTDFSACNDAALSGIADQGEEYRDWLDCRGTIL